MEMHLVEIDVGDLAAIALTEEATTQGIEIGDLIAAACAHLIDRLSSGSLVAKLPPAPGGAGELPFAAQQHLAAEIPEAQWQLLRAEAARRGVTVNLVFQHAVLAYLAEPRGS